MLKNFYHRDGQSKHWSIWVYEWVILSRLLCTHTVSPRFTRSKNDENPLVTNTKCLSFTAISFYLLNWQYQKSVWNISKFLVSWHPLLRCLTVFVFFHWLCDSLSLILQKTNKQTNKCENKYFIFMLKTVVTDCFCSLTLQTYPECLLSPLLSFCL